jgi:hypothetical protein
VQGYLLGRPAAIGQFRHLTHTEIVLDAAAGDTPALRAKSA